MRTLNFGVLALTALAYGCGQSSTPASPTQVSQPQTSGSSIERPASILLAAPTTLSYQDARIVAGAVLENSVPFGTPAPVEGSIPVTGTLVVWNGSGRYITPIALPAGLRVTRAWIVRRVTGSTTDGTAYQLAYSERDDAITFSLDFSDGPAIGPTAVVDAVVELTDGTGVYLLRAPNQKISATYTNATDLMAAPLTATLVGQAVALSGGGLITYHVIAPVPLVSTFDSGVTVRGVDGTAVSSGIKVLRAWVCLGDKAWLAPTFSESASPTYHISFSGAPSWGLAVVYVAAELTDGTSTVVVRAPASKVGINPVVG